jgi:hypothetical protein
VSPEMQAFMEEVACDLHIPIEDLTPVEPERTVLPSGHRLGLSVTFPCLKHDVEFDTLVGLCAYCSGSGRRRATRIIAPPGGVR